MLFCAYCGKSFTRKEHLERHIPSRGFMENSSARTYRLTKFHGEDTNVKPHRCTYCQLSFARRDLLQRHYSIYHEVKDSSIPTSYKMPTFASRSPIACINCASAKTGCDKMVPCARCTEKSLPCAARYARRQTKASRRAMIVAGEAHESEKEPISMTRYRTAVEAKTDGNGILQDSSRLDTVHTQNPLIFSDSEVAEVDFGPSDTFDEVMKFGGDMLDPGVNYEELLLWGSFQEDDSPYSSLLVDSSADLHQISSFEQYHPSSSVSTSGNISTSMLDTTRSSPESQDLFDDLNKICSGNSSNLDMNDVPDHYAVLASESAWPMVRCNTATFSGTCPRTAIIHLESLKHCLKNRCTWQPLFSDLDEPNHGCLIFVQPLLPSSRDRLHNLAQMFFRKAFQTHQRSPGSSPDPSNHARLGESDFLVLPGTKILEHFIRGCAQIGSLYYSLSACETIDTNELVQDSHASALLVLLMIAQGATLSQSYESRYLSAGLTEICRISLFDIIERDIELCADSNVLHSALLFTMLGAWSGDKWHMDIVMGQRGMYLAMIKHAGMLEPADIKFELPHPSSIDLKWREWRQAEGVRRIVYNWVLLDQELSLFHDLSAILSITNIEAPMPNGHEQLWLAKTSQEWFSCIQNQQNPGFHTVESMQQDVSLLELFQDFLHDRLDHHHSSLSLLRLRLLLHPIQSLLYNIGQISTKASGLSRHFRGRYIHTNAAALMRLEEARLLLQRWHTLYISHVESRRLCNVTCTNSVIYHLIYLNTIVSFPEIERLARKDRIDSSTSGLTLRLQSCVYGSTEEAMFHAGQVLGQLRCMPPHHVPQWSAVAIYRATMILWVACLERHNALLPQLTPLMFEVIIDQVSPEDPNLASWLRTGDGTPTLTNDDGSYMALNTPHEILIHGVEFLRTLCHGRLAEGIRRKLRLLYENWHGNDSDEGCKDGIS